MKNKRRVKSESELVKEILEDLKSVRRELIKAVADELKKKEVSRK
jgi:hypothetical protein